MVFHVFSFIIEVKVRRQKEEEPKRSSFELEREAQRNRFLQEVHARRF